MAKYLETYLLDLKFPLNFSVMEDIESSHLKYMKIYDYNNARFHIKVYNCARAIWRLYVEMFTLSQFYTNWRIKQISPYTRKHTYTWKYIHTKCSTHTNAWIQSHTYKPTIIDNIFIEIIFLRFLYSEKSFSTQHIWFSLLKMYEIKVNGKMFLIFVSKISVKYT